MSVAAAAVLVGLVVVLARRLGLVARALEAMAVASATLRVLRDRDLDDDAKELTARRAARRLAILSCLTAVGGAIAVALPMAALWLIAHATQTALFKGALDTTVSWPFLAASTAAVVGLWWLERRRDPG